MKFFPALLVFLFLCASYSNAQTPTYAGIPGQENVLVVYKQPTSLQDTLGLISDSVKEYYRLARNIPAANVIFPGLRFPDTTFSVDGVTHTVGLRQGSDIIRDLDNHNSGTWYATEHAYKYFYKYVALPIKNYLTQHNLTNQIRYIVLCKGVPMKIQAGGDHPDLDGNIGIDGLLCLLNTEDYEGFLETLFQSFPTNPNREPNRFPYIANQYFDSDPDFTLNNRFTPNFYTQTNKDTG